MTDDTDQQTETPRRAPDWVLGGLLFALILVYYGIQLPGFVVPGRWADLLVSLAGMEPNRPLIRPIWSSLLALLADTPIRELAFASQVCSALVGASSCLLLFGILRRIPYTRTRQWRAAGPYEQGPRMLSGVVAALYAAVATPALVASTRGDFAGFGAFLFLLALYPSFRYLHRPHAGWFLLSSALFGVALAEYPAALFLAPVWALWWMILAWKYGHLKWLVAGALLVLGVAAAVWFGFAAAWSAGDAAAWRDATAGDALRELARNHVAELMRSVPRVGWLLILCISVLPMTVFFSRDQDIPRDRTTAIGVVVWHLVLVALAVGLLFTMPLSLSGVTDLRVVLVAPALLIAAWFGSLAGRYHRIAARSSHPWLRHVLAGLLIGTLAAAAVHQARRHAVAQLAPIAESTRAIVAGLDGRSWLLTDGSLDSMLRLAARAEGLPLRLLRVDAAPGSLQSRYHASLFTNAALRSIAAAGTRPLLLAWQREDPGITGRVASLVSPEIWRGGSVITRPAPLFYVLDAPGAVLDPDAMQAEFASAWERLDLPDLARIPRDQPGWLQAYTLVRWTSRLANDLGVHLDDHARPDAARAAYRRALAIWPDNVSATLNLLADARRRDAPEADALKQDLAAQLERTRTLFNPRFIPQLCGNIRSAAAQLEEAALFGRAGQQREALERLEQASLLLESGDERGQHWLARLYSEGLDPAQGEALYERLLAENPADTAALTGLLRVALARRDFDLAGVRIEQLAALGVPAEQLDLERAHLHLHAGRLEEARTAFLSMTKRNRVPIEAWYGLALAAHLLKDDGLYERVAPSLEGNRFYIPGLLLTGERAVMRGDSDKARSAYEQVLALDAANRPALIRLTMMHYADRDAARLRDRAASLLSLDPDNPLGQFAMANVHLAGGELELAEVALRRCLARRDFAQAHNDLAWIVAERGGNLDEALTHALRASEQRASDPNIWDTVAFVRHKRGEPEQAVAAIERALTLADGRSPGILLSAARLNLVARRYNQAAAVLDQLKSMRELLPPPQMKELNALEAQLQYGTH